MDPTEKMGLIFGTFFAVVGILFFVTSLGTVLQIKNYFYDFYNDHKCVLYTTIFGLSIPIIMRAFFDFLKMAPFF